MNQTGARTQSVLGGPAAAVLLLSLVLNGCSSVEPTQAPTEAVAPTPVPTLTRAGPVPDASVVPGWVVDAVKRWGADSPEAHALQSLNTPYLVGGTANGNPNGISFTPTQARRWWDYWFLHPVDLGAVAPDHQPDTLVLSEAELLRARALMAGGNTLPKAPANYNPLGLPVIP